jgi:2,3-bisphosphoglycerate-independent phosphoglycerate mutase
VPFAMIGKGIVQDGVRAFDEETAKRGGYGVVDAIDLMRSLLRKNYMNYYRKA